MQFPWCGKAVVNFERAAKLFSEWLYNFVLLLPMNESSCFPHPRQHLMLSVSCTSDILTGVQWYHLLVLSCISLITCEATYLFRHLFVICIFTLVKCLLKSFVYFLKSTCFLIVQFYNFSVYFGYQFFIRCIFCKHFLPVF